MNMADLEPLKRQAQHNYREGWSWCFAHPQTIDGLIEDYRVARMRLERIRELAQRAEIALADHHLGEDHDPCVKGLLGEIVELSKI